MPLQTQSFCHVTFAFFPFTSVANLAHALVQLGGVLANSIRVAVVEPQGTLIHICKETAGSGGARDGGTRPAHIQATWCRAAGMHTCTCLHSEAETCRGCIWAYIRMLAVRGYQRMCEQPRSVCTKILYSWINTSSLGSPRGLADSYTETVQVAEGAMAVPLHGAMENRRSTVILLGIKHNCWRSSDTPMPPLSGCHWPQTDGKTLQNWDIWVAPTPAHWNTDLPLNRRKSRYRCQSF